MNKPEIIEKLIESGVEFDEKANKDELKKLLEQQDNTEDEPKDDTQSDSEEVLDEIESKQYVVIHDFKDLKDNDTIYIKGDIYPRRADAVVDKERIQELMSSENKIGEPLIKEQD